MKPKIYTFLICLITALLCSNAALAKTETMIFWYPGEAGSTEEAQPVLDLFFDKINESIAPSQIQGKYFNSVKEGLSYFKNKKPRVGIISFAAWIQNRDKLGDASVLLATLPLPGGKNSERYALVGRGKKVDVNLPVLSSEPMSAKFIGDYLFPELGRSKSVSNTDQLLHTLKKIGDGELNALAVLTPTEFATFKGLNADWKKGLYIIAESKPVPSARVVAFDPSWEKLGDFKNTLLSIEIDPEGKEILTELRLKGFSMP